MQYRCFLILLFLGYSKCSFAQTRSEFDLLVNQQSKYKTTLDSIAIELIKIVGSPNINDTLKADIVDFLGGIKSDTATNYLIQNITYVNRSVMAKDTNADKYFLQPYMFSIINNMIVRGGDNSKWWLFNHLLNYMKTGLKDDDFLYHSAMLFYSCFEKKSLLILISEVNKANGSMPDITLRVYRQNLTKIIANFEKF